MTENQNKDTLKKKIHVVPIDVSCVIPIIENNRNPKIKSSKKPRKSNDTFW